MATWIAKLAAMLTLNHSQFSAGLRTAGQEAQGFQQKVERTGRSAKTLGDRLNSPAFGADAAILTVFRRFAGPIALVGSLVRGVGTLNAELDRAAQTGASFVDVMREWKSIANSLVPTLGIGERIGQVGLNTLDRFPQLRQAFPLLNNPLLMNPEVRTPTRVLRGDLPLDQWNTMLAESKRALDALRTPMEVFNDRVKEYIKWFNEGIPGVDRNTLSSLIDAARKDSQTMGDTFIGRQLTSRQAFVGGAPATIGRVPVQMDQQVIDILRSIERKLEATPGRAG